MMASKSYRDLIVWQKAMDLVDQVYFVSGDFPREENFGLTGQIRRCAVSIPSNIAEGQGRNSQKEFQRFLKIALGSLAELDTQLEIAMRQGYLQQEQHQSFEDQIGEVRRLLYGLLRSMRPEN
jgi:four helix bundle protein